MLTAETIDRLKAQLLTSGLSQRDQDLFQIINLLIDAARQSLTEISQITGGGGGGGGALGATYITQNIETGSLPNSRQIMAGSGINIQHTPTGRTVIHSSVPLSFGEEGSDGEMGPPGPQGIQGIAGIAGAQGPSGIGIPGVDGEDGEDGLPGIPGATGATGAAGPQGLTGTSGIGMDGNDGEDGLDSLIPGPIGPIGPTGPAGSSGSGSSMPLMIESEEPEYNYIVSQYYPPFNNQLNTFLSGTNQFHEVTQFITNLGIGQIETSLIPGVLYSDTFANDWVPFDVLLAQFNRPLSPIAIDYTEEPPEPLITGPTSVDIRDEGVRLGLVNALNFTGAGVTASVSGFVGTVNIAGGGGSVNVKQTEVDFGVTPSIQQIFTVVDADVSASSQLIGTVAYEAPTGKDLDEMDMDDIDIKFAPGSGQFDVIVTGMEGYLADKFKINYLVG